MRCPVVPSAAVLLLLCASSFAQEAIDFNQSVDPVLLEAPILFEQLDTSVKFRVPVSLQQLIQEFPTRSTISIETYYQKSPNHMLLKLGSGALPLAATYAFSEGQGSTYFRVSDDICSLLLEVENTIEGKVPGAVIRDRTCTY
ncbi:MAG: hypothetical protein OEQ53_08320 [Saprospiraceae bacterium]|nr:hypothetical protein [Saprospiraceae bacterium]